DSVSSAVARRPRFRPVSQVRRRGHGLVAHSIYSRSDRITAMKYLAYLLTAAALTTVTLASSAPADLALRIVDYAALPITGAPNGEGNNAGSLARVNTMREEPAP